MSLPPEGNAMNDPEDATVVSDGPPPEVLDELLAAFEARPEPGPADAPRASQPGDVAPSIVAESLVPESTRRSRRRSRREAKREAKDEAKRIARLDKQAKRLAKQQRKAAKKKSRPQQDVDVEGGAAEAATDDDGAVRIIPAPPADASAGTESEQPAVPRATVAIDDDGMPDPVYLEGELGTGGSATVIPAVGGGDRSTVFIDDRGPGTGEIVAIDVATSAARIEPRMRERRVAVKRAAGRKRLGWLAVAALAVTLVAGALALLGSSVFAINTVDVEGAVYSQGPELVAAVDVLNGANVLRVDTEEVERMVEAIPWVADARVTTDFPHGATIEIRERRPMVAYLAADNRYRVLDRDGRVLDVLDGRPVEYVELRVDDGPTLEPGKLAPSGYRAAATLVSALTPQMRQRATSVSVDQNALELSMTLDDDIEVRFGAPEDLQDKLVRLQTALTDPNPELTATELIDVSTEDMIVR
jgi:cell division septal protein FtsQ